MDRDGSHSSSRALTVARSGTTPIRNPNETIAEVKCFRQARAPRRRYRDKDYLALHRAVLELIILYRVLEMGSRSRHPDARSKPIVLWYVLADERPPI